MNSWKSYLELHPLSVNHSQHLKLLSKESSKGNIGCCTVGKPFTKVLKLKGTMGHETAPGIVREASEKKLISPIGY